MRNNTSQSLMNVLFPANRQHVLATLLLQPTLSFHLRELARQAGTNPGTMAREVEKLTQVGLILRSRQGNQVRYQANTRHPLFVNLADMFRKTHGVVPALREALAALGQRIRLAFVFGSLARGDESEGSDVDVFVLGGVGFVDLAQALHPLHEQFGREVNPVLYAPEEFAARLESGDAFARDLMAKPRLWITGGEDDLVELASNRSPASASA